MSQEYQQRLLESFFSALPGVSQSTCHQVAAQLLSPHAHACVKIEPAPVQGSLSYTCMADVPCGGSNRTIIQFRTEKLNLESTREAHKSHGSIVPEVTFHGLHDKLFVYVSPFAHGEPYIKALMSPNGEPELPHRLRTPTDLASMFVRLFTEDGLLPLDALSILSSIEVYSLACKGHTKQLIDRCVAIVQRNAGLVDSLPIVLAHSDLTPFNFLVEPTTGQVTAVLDWNGATFERVGYNLHFAEHLFGYMTLKGWVDYEDRKVVEEAFHSQLQRLLSAQGVEDSEKFVFSMELSKAVGLLQYYVPRMKKDSTGLWEGYLISFLKKMSWEQAPN
jgi:Phosphotransferase enzyme family